MGDVIDKKMLPHHAVLLVYLPSWLGQETVKRPLRSQAATCFRQSNHSKVEAIPLSVLPKGTTSELADRLIFTLSLFNAERQATPLLAT